MDNGINFILQLQALGDWLVMPMRLFTFLGQEEFFLLFMPALYWCLDSVLGLRLGVILMLSNGLNAVFKLGFHSPRPYWYSTRVIAYVTESSFGMPSGHAMNASAMWGLLASSLRRAWAWLLLLALILLIGLSRLYLGVHFPSDVVVGWVLGFILLWLFLLLEKPAMTWFATQSLAVRLVISFIATLVLIVLGVLIKRNLGSWQIPAIWIENAAHSAPQAEPIDPLSLSGLFSSSGALLGLASGAIWLNHRGSFEVGGPWGKRLLRYPIGLLGVILIWFGLGAIFPRGEYLLAYILRYLRYSLVGFWISGLAPLVFIWAGLAHPQKRGGREKDF